MNFSLLLSVYDKEKPEYIDDCFNSIINQSILPTEIVLVQDGSLTDELNITLDAWSEKFSAINVDFLTIPLEQNKGLAIALNKGLEKCKCEYVARMDIDDVCYLDRFEKQINTLQKNPDIAVLGGQVAEYNEDMKELLSYRKVPISPNDIRKFIRRRSPFNHPTVVFNKKIVKSVGGYPEHLRNWQDYALWCKIIAKEYSICNLPDVLVKMRTGDNLIKRRSGIKYVKYELDAYKYVYRNHLISIPEYVLIICIKFTVRLLPHRIIKLLYKSFLRKKRSQR